MSVAQIHSILDDYVQLVNLARRGIRYSLFEDIMASSSFTMKQWSRFLHLTERTIQRYKKEKKKFEPIQSERIIQLARLQQKGEELFGDKDHFEAWLNTDNIALGGVRPIDLLDSTFGIDLIEEELGRIAHGVLA